MFKWTSSEDGDSEEDLSFTLIKDTVDKSGRLVLKAIASSRFSNDDFVSCICYEMPVPVFKEGLPSDSIGLEFIDAFSDPLSWRNPDSGGNCFSPEFLAGIEINKALVIDSLSSYLVHNSVQSLYRSIYNRMSEDTAPICGLLHADVHPLQDCALLESLATTVINIIPDSISSDLSLCQISLRRGNKKPLVKTCTYKNDFELLSSFKFKEYKSNTGTTTIKTVSDPAANLTFNLKLTESEKKSRSEVPLPYVINAGVGEKTANTIDDDDGAEYLEDEDDPDDDLDF